jgi:N-acetyl-gamma-glutamyl-phosphate reductase
MPSLLERWSRRRRAAHAQPAAELPTPAPKVAVFGASGFAGALAARLIDRHPRFQLTTVTSRSDAGKQLSELYPQHRVDLYLEEFDIGKHGAVDAAIVAYPHGAAAELVKQLREQGVRVVDLSADFRLRDLATYEEWYVQHPAPELIAGAVYGLPEFYREQIKSADLVANQAATRPPRSWHWHRLHARVC